MTEFPKQFQNPAEKTRSLKNTWVQFPFTVLIALAAGTLTGCMEPAMSEYDLEDAEHNHYIHHEQTFVEVTPEYDIEDSESNLVEIYLRKGQSDQSGQLVASLWVNHQEHKLTFGTNNNFPSDVVITINVYSQDPQGTPPIYLGEVTLKAGQLDQTIGYYGQNPEKTNRLIYEVDFHQTESSTQENLE